ncbi:hypothetical protein NDU88_004580 [Pleurodeles waltl]|uniref:Uncharacterized protein n=1 Tax=Pleurodeles waltl TaxID=8319 RepID=A0AAV7MUB4_PLEWA|nr:hypothetical protein NDU88_004580 [Pleurodeles waltl]
MVALGTLWWATAAGALRKLCTALWFLLQRCYDTGSTGRDSTSCHARGSEIVIAGEKTETTFAAARDSRHYYALMEIDGWWSDGELGPGTGVSLGSQCIRRAAQKQQGSETIDKTWLLQDSVNRYTLRSRNSQWAVGRDDAELDQAKVKAPARQVKSRARIPLAKASNLGNLLQK